MKEVELFFGTKSVEPAKYTAPPSGLFLEHVYYEGEKREEVLESTLQVETPHHLGRKK
jgi:hypothetical protein